MLKLGTQSISALYLGEWAVKRAYLGESVVFEEVPTGRLPDGYTEVEYIQSNDGAYIDTKICPTNTLKFVIDIEPTETPSSTNAYFWGTNHIQLKHFFLCTWTSSGVRFATSANSSGSAAYVTLSTDKTPRRMKIIVDCPARTASIVGENEVSLLGTLIGTTKTIGILAFSGGGSPVNAKLYSNQIYIDGTLSCDFVPCIDPSGAVGLYDMVTGEFYANAGTGVFTPGPAV